MVLSMRQALWLMLFAIPASPQKSPAGSNTPVNSSDLGYRIGSIEAKIENQGKTLDDLKADLKQVNTSVAGLSADTKRISDKLSLIGTVTTLTGGALLANLMALLFKNFAPKPAPEPPSFRAYGIEPQRRTEQMPGEERERQERERR